MPAGCIAMSVRLLIHGANGRMGQPQRLCDDASGKARDRRRLAQGQGAAIDGIPQFAA